MVRPTPVAEELSRRELHRIEHLPASELDALPFGVIRLDDEGTVLSYNRAEAALTGRDPQQVIGRNFFTEVAPCANLPAFAGRFRAGVARRHLLETFPYRFDFRMAPRAVTVTLFYSDVTGSAWIFVRTADDPLPPRRRGDRPAAAE